MMPKVTFPIDIDDVEELQSCPICEGAYFKTISEVYLNSLNFLKTVLCTQCGFVFRQTRPSLRWFHKSWEIRKQQVSAVAQYCEDTLIEKRRYLRYERLARFIEDKMAGRSLLDIGSGPGTGLKAFHRRKWDVTGLEPDPSRAKVGREQHGLNILEGSIENFHGDREGYSLVMAIHVLEHFHSPVDFMNNVVRQVENGGFVYIVRSCFFMVAFCWE